jgi:hypothetical protein
MVGCSSGAAAMPESILAARAGLNIALAFTLPLLVWLLGQAMLSSGGQIGIATSMQGMMATLLLLQAMALVWCLPQLMRFPAAGDRCSAIVLILLVPAPLYAISWLGGGTDFYALVLSMSILAGLALISYGLYATCIAWSAPGRWRASILLFMQMIAVGLCWNYRYFWEQVLAL